MKSFLAPFQLLLAVIYLAIVAAQTSGAPLACKPYIPYGPNDGKPNGKINFDGNGAGGWGYPNQPDMTLQGNHDTAWTFFARACNSSTLNLYSSTYNPSNCNPKKTSCVDAIRTDYIQVINTKTGNCMTNDNESRLVFIPCNQSPSDQSQLWLMNSTSNDGGRAHFLFSLGSEYDGPTFIISSDRHYPGVSSFDPDGFIVNATWYSSPN